jgi:hypothetical protein
VTTQGMALKIETLLQATGIHIEILNSNWSMEMHSDYWEMWS